MLEKDLETLKNVAPDWPLDALETSIWTKVAADAQLAHSRSLVLGWQASIVALVVVGSFAVSGMVTTERHPTADQLDVFSAQGLPAPSTLLLGPHT